VGPGFDPLGGFPLLLLFLGVAMLLAIIVLSRQGERPFSATLAYLALGVLGAVLIGLFDLPWIDVFQDPEPVEHLAELALTVALFGAGLKIERAFTLRGWRTVIVLLGVVMPLTIAAVAAYGTLAMGLSLGAAIVLGSILAPTDPVLAGDVGEGPPGEPSRGEARFNLTAEAAFNDGLASPFVLLGLFVVQQGGLDWVGGWLLTDVAYAVGAGVALGAAAGYGFAALAARMRRRKMLLPELDGFLIVGVVFVVYGATDALDAYGLLAVFVAGIAFRRYEIEHEYNRRVHDGAEVATNFLELAVILVLGSLVTVRALGEPGAAGWLLPPLLLVLLRPAMVVALVRPSWGLSLRERAFVGWLGVRGIASIYYATFVLAEGALPADEAGVVFWTAAFCVIVSIAAHGITQTLAIRRLLAEA
jgi:NhaP-type Na+/H+ or K+/H+ antiporter